MKKFSKLIAVVLAIAVIICPMMSVVSHATTTNGYKIEANPNDANELMLTITSTDGFVAYDATVTFNSPSAFQSTYGTGEYVNGLRLISREVKGGEANSHNLPTISSNMTNDTTLKVIVIKDDFTGDDLYTKLVIGLRVAAGSTATLTKIQAADQGTVAEDSTLLTFPAANASTGEIDQTDEYAIENAKVVAHTHSFILTSVQDATTLKTAATCTAAAVYYKTCSCGAVSNDDNDTYTVGAALGHSFTNYVSDGNATCTQDGTKTATCDRTGCNETDTVADVGSALGHSYTNYSSDNNATCAQDGTKTAYCDHDCGNTDTITDEGSHTSVAHTWGEYVSDGNATCLVDGTKTRTCSVCKATEKVTDTDSHLLVAHTVVNDAAVAATCTATGLTAGTHCSVCGAVITAQTVVPALGHEYTYDANGGGTHTVGCERCDYSAQEACDTNGTDGICSKCGYKAAPAGLTIDNTIVMATGFPLVNVQDTLSFVFRVSKSNTKTKYGGVPKLKVSRRIFDSTYNYNSEPTVTEVETYSSATASNFMFMYSGIGMYELSLPMEVTIIATDANGVEVAQSQTYTYTPCIELKAKYDSLLSSDVATCRLIVDLVNLGTEAQKYFSEGKDCDLANVAYPNEAYPQDLATTISDSDLKAKLSVITPNVQKGSDYSNYSITLTPMINLRQNPALLLRVGGCKAIGKNNIDYSITYYNPVKKVEVTAAGSVSDWSGSTNFTYVFDKIAFYDMAEPVTLTYSVDGNTVFTVTCNIESIIANQDLTTSAGKVYKAVAIFSQTASEVFKATS